MIPPNAMKTIQQIWDNKLWPIRNGIYFDDGRVALLNISMPWENVGKAVSVSVASLTQLEQIDEFRENCTTHLSPLCQESYPDMNLRVYGGEGGHGSEGFIAVTQISTGHLLWLAYFDCSNPFERVSVTNGIVIGVSNLGDSWNFPLTQPDSFSVNANRG